ncbi:hypothetical protein ACO22_03679 [Paracoccidioides brasiliensis]|uniref:Zn(2)-C6 fungal-type domain-containing protein n=1 Tax=Paracoccidioides brasiliensis TaxID=121759 RepID=A0A1D2JF81_PARBR|nr:hypothetical protein ACO22_03679 [Paracoccidioides brasiliensis]
MTGVNPSSAGQFNARSGQPSPNPPSRPNSPTEQQKNSGKHGGGEQRANTSSQNVSGWVPRPKRIACVICRRRKLRCDGNKPSCGTCSRLGHDCAYDEVRKKSGPKRGYVKQLEARLAQVETLLQSQDSGDGSQVVPAVNLNHSTSAGLGNNTRDIFSTSNEIEDPPPLPLEAFGELPSTQANLADNDVSPGEHFSWEMIGLGLDEPFPAQDVIDELNEIYFQKIHPSLPIIHRPRFYAAMDLAPTMRPPVCLRYMMWCLASSVTDEYQSLHPHFYQRARKYAELDQMRGLGEAMVNVAHSQTWTLIASYEFKMMYFPRAWMSTGHATRLALMMGLHRQDGSGSEIKQCIPPARDWTELEERRRTFWVAFCQDRYASVGTGWPMIVDERDILTNLPSTEEAFINCKVEKTYTLSSVLAGENISTLSPLGAIVLLACLFGRSLHHLHRSTPGDKDHDLNGGFWKRHRALDNILLNTSLSLPSHLRVPEGINDSSIVFINMCIHTSIICLHQAAIFKAEKNGLPSQIAAEGKRRCIVAADQITSIMKMASHLDMAAMNPFLAFCLYVAGRVFLQCMKSRTDDESAHSSLQFLLVVMNALKRKNPLTESLIMQLDADLEEYGLAGKTGNRKFSYGMHFERTSIPRSDYCSSFKGVFEQAAPPPGTLLTSPYDITTIPVCPTLSNREKSPTGFAPAVGNDIQNQIIETIASFIVPTNDNFIKSMAVDMDVSTEASVTSDLRYLSSDNPTPGTNPSSNSSISPRNIDQPSPPTQQLRYDQMQPSQKPNPNMYPTEIPTSQFEPLLSSNTQPAYANYFTPGNPPDTPGLENPFAFTTGWDIPINQPRDPITITTSEGLVEEIHDLSTMTWAVGADILSWEDYQVNLD